MPVPYAFVGNILEIRVTGNYMPRDVEAAFRQAFADPARPTLRALLYDARDSAVIGERTTPDVREAIRFFEGLREHIGQRVALLASTDVAYGVMRMVAGWAAAAGLEAEVFREPAEALDWAER
ncbi:MAG: hypothetical protein ACJ79K_14595 [Gemmatimonadaceae bacterium]